MVAHHTYGFENREFVQLAGRMPCLADRGILSDDVLVSDFPGI